MMMMIMMIMMMMMMMMIAVYTIMNYVMTQTSITEPGSVAQTTPDILEANVLFNDAVNTFLIRLYGVGYKVKQTIHIAYHSVNLTIQNGEYGPSFLTCAGAIAHAQRT